MRTIILREKYLSFLQKKHPNEYNPNYRTRTQKKNICKNCGSKLKLWQPNSKRELVYSSDVRQGHASALENASSDEQLLINSACFTKATI